MFVEVMERDWIFGQLQTEPDIFRGGSVGTLNNFVHLLAREEMLKWINPIGADWDTAKREPLPFSFLGS